MLKPPPPATKTARLISAGYPEPRATKHVYLLTRECVVNGPNGEAWEQIFRCVETDAQRRWGLLNRNEVVN